MIQQEAMDIYATSTGKKKTVKAGGPGSGCHGPNCGGWKHGGKNEGEGYKGHYTSFFDHPKHGSLEIKHSGPFRENPVTVKHNGKRVFTGNHDATRGFLRKNYGIRYGGPNEQG